jgi:hypothetical protein
MRDAHLGYKKPPLEKANHLAAMSSLKTRKNLSEAHLGYKYSEERKAAHKECYKDPVLREKLRIAGAKAYASRYPTGRTPVHGTQNEYGNHACRCEPCRIAHHEWGKTHRISK